MLLQQKRTALVAVSNSFSYMILLLSLPVLRDELSTFSTSCSASESPLVPSKDVTSSCNLLAVRFRACIASIKSFSSSASGAKSVSNAFIELKRFSSRSSIAPAIEGSE